MSNVHEFSVPAALGGRTSSLNISSLPARVAKAFSMSDNQASPSHVDPKSATHASEPPRSPIMLLVIIALLLGALIVFGALDS